MDYWIANEMGSGGDTGKKSSHDSSRRSNKHTYHSDYSHSKSSILSVMEKFVRSVDNMNETILIPSRLLDMDTEDASAKLGSQYASIEPFQFYSTLNKVKNELMWGGGPKEPESSIPSRIGAEGGSFFAILPPNNPISTPTSSSPTGSSSSSTSSKTSIQSSQSSSHQNQNQSQRSEKLAGSGTGVGTGGNGKGHQRRPSTVSIISSSSNSTGSDTEFSELNDNDSGVEVEDEYSLQLSDAFRHHLLGLHKTLSEFSQAAKYITNKYEVGYDHQN